MFQVWFWDDFMVFTKYVFYMVLNMFWVWRKTRLFCIRGTANVLIHVQRHRPTTRIHILGPHIGSTFGPTLNNSTHDEPICKSTMRAWLILQLAFQSDIQSICISPWPWTLHHCDTSPIVSMMFTCNKYKHLFVGRVWRHLQFHECKIFFFSPLKT